jgi:hypothetical protein
VDWGYIIGENLRVDLNYPSTWDACRKSEGSRGLEFHELGRQGGKSTLAFEVAKARGRSRAVDFSDRSRPLIVFMVEGHPSDVASEIKKSRILWTRGLIHSNLRNPEP